MTTYQHFCDNHCIKNNNCRLKSLNTVYEFECPCKECILLGKCGPETSNYKRPGSMCLKRQTAYRWFAWGLK